MKKAKRKRSQADPQEDQQARNNQLKVHKEEKVKIRIQTWKVIMEVKKMKNQNKREAAKIKKTQVWTN